PPWRGQRGSERNDRKRDRGRHDRDHRRENEEYLVRLLRQCLFLQDVLQPVGDRLQQTGRAHTVGTEPVLDPGGDLPLEERQHRDRDQDDDEDDEDLHDRDDPPRRRRHGCKLVHQSPPPAPIATGSFMSAPRVPIISYVSPAKGSKKEPTRRNAFAASAGAGPSSSPASSTPSTCHAGRASGGACSAGQKRCTRPSKFVKVPSCSANVETGSTKCALRAAGCSRCPR